MNVWLTMIIAGAVTYGIRLSFIALTGQREFSPSVQRSLRFVAPAVLAAILFPELFLNGDTLDISLSNTRLIAGILAIVVAWGTKSVTLTIVVGMGALLAMQWLM